MQRRRSTFNVCSRGVGVLSRRVKNTRSVTRLTFVDETDRQDGS